ncbi:LysR family transcriptional regulator [Pseudomonas aeruginosa]|uniref:LysR family transcriptional regulator n=1 Tax=Pseudomonas aeruginosa TaxID=287 RepID=UPI001F49785D|nr:LysR family transcriptional regulator [Pseudomonas aeruginosa]
MQRSLYYFVVVAEEQSFARAAERIHIEPSALSRAIGSLESKLGVRLLNRSKGKISLTWPGEVYRDEAKRILFLLDAASSKAKAAELGYRGYLRIGIADGLAQPEISRLLARCRQEEPLTEIRIFEMTACELLSAIRAERIDAGFTVHPELQHREVAKEVAWFDRPVIVIPALHPLMGSDRIAMSDIEPYKVVTCHPELCDGGHCVFQLWFRHSRKRTPVIAEYVSGHESMMMLVAAGAGVGLGLESQALMYSRPDVVMRPLADDFAHVETFLMYPNKSISNELVRFVERVRNIDGKTEALGRAPLFKA